jgi:tRNA U34 5-methylaminomethyl-2-thiouridine-forming methyltransferase MnmC
MMPSPIIEFTEDGSATLRSPVHGDTYHSLRGAVGESRHVFIENGFSQAGGTPVKILEMGFGTGLNAWLTLLEAERAGREVEYTALELYPVPPEVAAQLGYSGDERFMALHTSAWGEWSEPSDGFRLRKMHGAAAEIFAEPNLLSNFDLIYWDAFAPDTQPDLWTAELFARVFEATAPGGILVTYSSKGDVRRALKTAGFTVERLPGALGKRHMVRAVRGASRTGGAGRTGY